MLLLCFGHFNGRVLVVLVVRFVRLLIARRFVTVDFVAGSCFTISGRFLAALGFAYNGSGTFRRLSRLNTA